MWRRAQPGERTRRWSPPAASERQRRRRETAQLGESPGEGGIPADGSGGVKSSRAARTDKEMPTMRPTCGSERYQWERADERTRRAGGHHVRARPPRLQLAPPSCRVIRGSSAVGATNLSVISRLSIWQSLASYLSISWNVGLRTSDLTDRRHSQPTDDALRSAKPAGAQSERGRGDCGCGSVERASPQGRADRRVAGRGPGRSSTGRDAANILGPSGASHPAWLASGTTRRTALSTFRSDSLLLLHGRPRSRAHWSGALNASTPDATRSSSRAHIDLPTCSLVLQPT